MRGFALAEQQIYVIIVVLSAFLIALMATRGTCCSEDGEEAMGYTLP